MIFLNAMFWSLGNLLATAMAAWTSAALRDCSALIIALGVDPVAEFDTFRFSNSLLFCLFIGYICYLFSVVLNWATVFLSHQLILFNTYFNMVFFGLGPA